MKQYPVLSAAAIGKRIRDLRIANHLKVEEVRDYMGFESVQSVYKWQRGESLPTVDNLYALSKLFGTSMDYIVEGSREGDESPLPSFKPNRKIIFTPGSAKPTYDFLGFEPAVYFYAKNAMAQ